MNCVSEILKKARIEAMKTVSIQKSRKYNIKADLKKGKFIITK